MTDNQQRAPRRSGARWPDCATGWHDRCAQPTRCGCQCHTRAKSVDGLRDQLAEQAWGVLVEADLEGVTDPNLIAHAIVRNQLPLIEARVQAAASQRTAEALELAAVLTVPSEDTAADVREALLRHANALRAQESA